MAVCRQQLLTRVLAFYNHFNVVVQAWFPRQDSNFTHKIVGGVALDHDQVSKLKFMNFFLGVFDGDSRKFILAEISRYTVSVFSYRGSIYLHHITSLSKNFIGWTAEYNKPCIPVI